MTDQPRQKTDTAKTVVANTRPTSDLGPIPRHLSDWIRRRPFWALVPLFQDLSDDALDTLQQAMEPVTFVDQAVIMAQGRMGDDMFVIERGRVNVTVRDDVGNILFQTDLDGPALVGEMALVTHEPRTATVTAQGEVLAHRLRKGVLDDLFARQPQAASFLTALVGERLMETHGIRKVGKYEVVGRLGSGGVATVFEARQPGLNRSVALKMLSHSLVYDRNFAEHFGREGQLVAGLTHDNIVRVIDTEEAYGTRFIVMEKLDGELLEALIRRREELDWFVVRRILAEIASALAYSHEQGLIHRDVKPANVFMTENRRVKLLDFGIAVPMGVPTEQDGKVVGTPFYMSPEQILGLPLDGRADMYSLGILAYELCTNELPFWAENVQNVFSLHLKQETPDPRRLEPDLPDDLVEFIRICTAKEPLRRFATCYDAASFLYRGMDEASSAPHEMSTLALTYLPSRRGQVQQILNEALGKLKRLRGVQAFASNQVNVEVAALPRAADPKRVTVTSTILEAATAYHRPPSRKTEMPPPDDLPDEPPG
jgi:serine/threonine protein kinase